VRKKKETSFLIGSNRRVERDFKRKDIPGTGNLRLDIKAQIHQARKFLGHGWSHASAPTKPAGGKEKKLYRNPP